MKIIIAGLGNTGWQLAETVMDRGGDELTVIDADEKVCDRASAELDALVLAGDAADPGILEKARIGDTDALVAATGSDPINTVIAMLGRQAGVEIVVVRLQGTKLRSACQQIGVNRIVAPAVSAAAEMHASIRGFHRLDFSLAAHGALSLVDLEGRTVAGTRLADLDLPRGATVMALLREEKALFPHPDTAVEDEDVILTLVEDDDIRAELVDRFREPDQPPGKDADADE